MREIKFRGKRIDNGEWVYGFLANGGLISAGAIQIGIKSPNSRETAKMKAVIQAYQVDPKTVGQYTGLKDKNGKEIYEGDIVINEEGIKGVVTFNPKFSGFFVKMKAQKRNLFIPLNIFSINLQVIGNIYDDKELLED